MPKLGNGLAQSRRRMGPIRPRSLPEVRKRASELVATLEQKGAGHGQFTRLDGPISAMMREHDSAGLLLAEMRDLSADFTPPAGACPTFHAYSQGLREFEADLHQHIYIENSVLFPRALALATQK